MPYFDSGDEWLRQSTLLVQARPTTTRVTTRYNHAKPANRITRRQKDKKKPAKSQDGDSDATGGAQQASGVLTLRAYDPVSGVCLQYKTTKGQEVGRLIAALGRIGKCMSGRPDPADLAGAPPTPTDGKPATANDVADDQDTAMDDAPADEAEVEKAQAQGHSRQKKSVSFAEGPPQVQKIPPQQAQQNSGGSGGGGGGGGGGGKKKKKGKK